MAQPKHHCKLFVRNIPPEATREIMRHCSLVMEGKMGRTTAPGTHVDFDHEIVDLPKAPNPTTRRHRGFGFVQFTRADYAKTALETLKGRKFLNKQPLNIEYAAEKGATPKKPASNAPASPNESKAPKKKNRNKRSAEKEPVETVTDDEASKTIIVAGVPNDMTKQQIQEEMALLGTFKDLEYPYLTETQNSQKKNLAKLRLVTATVDHAVAVSLALRSWRPQGRKPFIEYSPTFAATQRKLIIHRVPPEFDEAQLEEVLKSFGSIAKVVIPRKGQFTDGRPGYAMVSMADMAGVHQVFNHVDGRDVGGWVLGVSWGLPKELQSQVKWNALDVTKAEAVADDNGNDSDPDGKLASESPLAVAMALRQGQEWRRQLGDTGAAQNGHTLFVQNLAFDTTEQELHERFSQLGELQYVAITKDRNTRLSRGTAFVCFKSKSAADKCIDMASGVQDYVQESVDPQNTAIKSRLPPSYKTVLVPETPKSLTGTELFTFNGRLMSIRPALDRHEAEARVAKAHGDKHVDRRNIYLLREGYIPEDSEQALATPKGDMQKRLMSYAQRKAALKANPNFFLSTTRLSIRNMPPSVTDASLKQLVKDALKNFKQEVSAGKRAPLTAEEQKEGYSKYPRIVQVKVTRDKARIDPKTNKQQSKGFGFVELAHHAHALVVLRYLNNNPKLFSSNRRPIVEFALENAQLLQKRERRKTMPASKSAADGSTNRKRKADGDAGAKSTSSATPGKKNEGARKKPKADGKKAGQQGFDATKNMVKAALQSKP